MEAEATPWGMGEGSQACLWKTRSQIKLEPQEEEKAEREGPCLEGWRAGTTPVPAGD